MRTVRPSSSCVTLIWQDKRLFGVTSGAKSSMGSSMSVFGGSLVKNASSTINCQVAQAHAPPQSASMPGTMFFTAPSMTDQPCGTSTTCSLPLCSMYLIFAIHAHFECTIETVTGRATGPARRSILLRCDADGRRTAAILEVDLLQLLDAFVGNGVANHASAFRLQFLHVDINCVEGARALCDQSRLDQSLDQHAEDVGR